MDILSTVCGVFMVHCVKLMLIFFEFEVLVCDCFVYRQNVTFAKHFTRYGITQLRWKTRSLADLQLSLRSLCQKLERSYSLMTLC